MNQKFSIFAVLLAWWIFGGFQLKAELTFSIEPVDSLTRLTLREAEVLAFIPGDSAVVAEGQTVSMSVDGMERQVKTLNLPHKDAEYNIYIDAPGYIARFIPLRTKKAFEEYALHDLGEIGLLRTPKRLDEVCI